MPAIRLQHAEIKITNQLLLKIDDFQIKTHQFTVIVGHNGSGKSTLAKFLAQKTAPYNGSYHNRFERISLLSFEQQQQLIEQIYRDLNNDCVDPDYHGRTAAEVILAGQQDHRALVELAETLQITALLDRPFKFLSTGEGRKVLLATALINRPHLLILDEPFEGLDQQSQHFWLELLTALCREMTVVLIINRLDDIPTQVDSIAMMNNCRLMIQDNAAAIRQSAVFQQLCHAENSAYQAIPLPAEAPQTLAQDLEFVFALRNVNVRYGEKHILQRLNWQVKPGENWWIKGPNGCGKSTLLALISGDHPQAFSNEVKIFGKQRGSGETVWQIKQKIGFLSNQFHLDYRVNCSALEVIVSGYFDSIGVYRQIPDSLRLNALQWLERIHMTPFANKPFRSLSWGQQRLLLIARAMVKHPPILILDEPLMGLDGINRHLVLTFIEQLIDNSATQLLFVSHHLEDQPKCINRTFEFIANNGTYDYYQS
ncbi:molybdate transport system ATP-binding protein [Pasteurella testudinis DSM 23072]|uniref:Molybdate transport system ATP-binding protein n=1 Tax=Pasteurella testudinis DSM 23072 TaxID=1122938 RepID=A0A1W1UC93_9PAST|nr:molybdate ABC transporter ATP-binding protein ModF [Pasteurella testudinis]SMB78718.1 molybdate transport system ATP-binding protein [Pasteurella testudinis DSM 23072]SUB52506.1 molybdenum transport ATP-binding protein ModF [Pasteurella testudinis]